MRRKNITVSDIAQAIGCSPSAVSRALNNKPGIGEGMRSRIRLTAMDMGYRFKKTAQQTAAHPKNHTISVVITRENFADENFYRTVIHGIESVLNEENISFFLSIVEKNAPYDIMEHFRQLRPEGTLVFGLVSPQILTDIMMLGIPMVLVDTVNLNFHADRITVDNERGGYDVVHYLWQEGHRRISFLGDINFSKNVLQRYEGGQRFLHRQNRALIPAGGIVQMELSGAVRLDEDKFAELMHRPHAPTAVFCANDRIAFEVYRAAQNIGLRIPQDLSVVGFDDVEKCEWVQPALTSVNVPKFEMGRKAVHALLERIRYPDAVTSLLQLDATLRIRHSVARVQSE